MNSKPSQGWTAIGYGADGEIDDTGVYPAREIAVDQAMKRLETNPEITMIYLLSIDCVRFRDTDKGWIDV